MRLIGQMLSWIYWHPIRRFVQFLPRKQVVSFGFLIGSINYYTRKRKRTIVTNEITSFFSEPVPQDQLENATLNSFRQSSVVGLETFCFPTIGVENVNAWMRVHGTNHLNRALQMGKGVVVVLAHFGANQMVMAALGYRGYAVNQIGSRPDDWHRISGIEPTSIEKKIFKTRLSLERYLPANFIYIDKSMRPVFSALKQNQIMLMAADGRAGSRFFSVPFCSRTMNVSAGPFRIAALTGASLIPVFPVRDTDGVHDLHIGAPIQPNVTATDASWAEKASVIYAEKLAEWVRLRPDHYAMLMAEARIRSKTDKVPLFEDFHETQ